VAIGINILAIRRVDFLEKYIATDKTTYSRIKIPTFEIIQPRFLIEHIPAIAERLHLAQRFRQLTGTPQRCAPRIIAVADDGIAILIQNCNRFAGQGQYSLYEEVFPAFAEVFAVSPSAACARGTGRDGLK